MPSPTITRRLYTADMRPDLWQFLDDPSHPLNKAWPYFLDQDGTQKHLSTRLCDFVNLRKFQCVVVEYNTETGEEELIACSRSIPFYWAELDQLGPSNGLDTHPDISQTLPDGGWDTIVARGIRQYMETHPDEASSWPWSSPPVMALVIAPGHDPGPETRPAPIIELKTTKHTLRSLHYPASGPKTDGSCGAHDRRDETNCAEGGTEGRRCPA